MINLSLNITYLQLRTQSWIASKNVKFPCLHRLRCFYAEDMPISLFHAVLRCNPHIQQLFMMIDEREYQSKLDISLLYALQSLTKFEMRDLNNLALLQLTQHEPMWPKLEELVLFYISDLDGPDTCQRFSGLDRKWGTTLKRLSLDFQMCSLGPEGLYPLLLPRLENIRLRLIWGSVHNLEFLLLSQESCPHDSGVMSP